MEAINIEAIMQEIREEIKEKGYTYDMLSFNDIEIDSDDLVARRFNRWTFEDSVDFANRNWQVQAYRVLETNGGLKTKLINFVKKIVRKCTKFYVEPVVRDQNVFNANAVKLFSLMQCYVSEKQEQIDELIREQENLKIEIAELKKMIQDK